MEVDPKRGAVQESSVALQVDMSARLVVARRGERSIRLARITPERAQRHDVRLLSGPDDTPRFVGGSNDFSGGAVAL
jgi:hypothetical protein